jgi:hypothetical protein
VIEYVLSAKRAAAFFALAIAIGYGILAFVFYLNTGFDPSYSKLAVISLASAGIIYLASRGLTAECTQDRRFVISFEAFIFVIWIPFGITVLLILATAPAIPIWTALTGGSADLVALQREEFLKGREGFAASFVYLNAFFTGALVPYTIALMFLHHFKWRWALTLLFLLYSLSFVEKAFFLKVLVPIIYLYSVGMVRSYVGPKTTLTMALGLLIFITTITGSGSEPIIGTSASFFQATYSPPNPIMHIVWRSIAVPLFTAADSLTVFQIYFFDEPLFGATSSFLAVIFGLQRIPFELIVFQFQWGQNEAGTGSSNSAFLIEAFVNYGWAGVIVFSLIIGRLFKMFADSSNEALKSVWPLFALGLYTSGLVGQLLSNGFLLLFLIEIFVRVRRPTERASAPRIGERTWTT